MLNKDVFVRDTLRLVTSEIKRFEVDNRKDPADEDIVAILKRMAKQRKDSIQQYKDGGRPDLEENEQKELDLLATYLPQALGGDASPPKAWGKYVASKSSSFCSFSSKSGLPPSLYC